MKSWLAAISILLYAGIASATGEWYSNISGTGNEVFAISPGETAYFITSGTDTYDTNAIDVSQCGMVSAWLFQDSGGAATFYIMETPDRAKTYSSKILKDADFDGLIDDDPLNGDPLDNLDRITFFGAIMVYGDIQTSAGSSKTAILAMTCIIPSK